LTVRRVSRVQVPRDDAGCCTLANKNRDGFRRGRKFTPVFYFCKSCRDYHNNPMTNDQKFRVVFKIRKKREFSPLLSKREVINILKETKGKQIIEIWDNDRPINCKTALVLMRYANGLIPA